MMRLVLMGVGVFLLSLGGTTGALVRKARAAHPAAADSSAAHADSAKTPADSARARTDSTPAHADTGSARIAQSGATPAVADSARPADSATGGMTAGTAALGAAPAATAAGAPQAGAIAAREAAAFKQLARIFANMKTTDAAKVLAYMSDDEVQGVLQQLGVRPAAGLLAALPKERAAALSRRMLTGPVQKAGTP